MNTTTNGTGLRRKVAAIAVGAGLLIAGFLGVGALAGGNGGASASSGAQQAAPAAPAPKPAASSASAASVPKPLENAGHYGENVYDQAKLGDWSKANAELASLKGAISQLNGTGVSDQGRLSADVAALEKAITARDQQAALLASNKVTFDVANASASYKTPVPVGVTKLDYYGRQLEIQAAAKDTAGLKQTAADIQSTWNQVRPQIVANGGTKEAKQFDVTVAQVQKAGTPAQYGKLANPVLAQVDFLENVFK